jgi:hypothetical protein
MPSRSICHAYRQVIAGIMDYVDKKPQKVRASIIKHLRLREADSLTQAWKSCRDFYMAATGAPRLSKVLVANGFALLFGLMAKDRSGGVRNGSVNPGG